MQSSTIPTVCGPNRARRPRHVPASIASCEPGDRYRFVRDPDRSLVVVGTGHDALGPYVRFATDGGDHWKARAYNFSNGTIEPAPGEHPE